MGVGSVRNVAHAADLSISTISLFGGENFEANITQYSTNVPNYNGKFSSVVVTPPGTATFYTQPNYGGRSICLQSTGGYQSHWTKDLSNLGIEPGDIKSIKFGCDSTNIFQSYPLTFALKQQDLP